MSEINEEKLTNKVKDEVTKYENLKKIFKNIDDSENKLYENRINAFLDITNINETEKDNEKLREIYSVFTEEMQKLESYRNSQMSRTKEIILPATSYYISRAKSYKKNIGLYKDIKKQKENEENERLKAQSNQERDKVNNLNKSINQNNSNLIRQGETLENDMVLFENERITSNKYLILHFIHSELAYHSNALEKLSQLYEKINDIEPIEELQDFVNKYKLTSIDDLSEFGYDSKKLRDRKRDREMYKSSVISQGLGGYGGLAESKAEFGASGIKNSKNKERNEEIHTDI